MGCRTSKSEQKEELNKLKYLVEADNENGLNLILKQEVYIKNNLNLVNEIRIFSENIHFSLLGYCVYKGKGKCFVCLVNVFRARVEDLFEQFEKEGLDVLETVYRSENLQIFQEVYSTFVKLEHGAENGVTPIQRACKAGNLGFIHYILNLPEGPASYKDLYLENNEGKNAVALALEQGVYSVFKYVAERCRKVSGIPDPIGYCLQQYNRVQGKEYLECAMYLIQSLHIPIQKSHLMIPTSCLTFNSFLINKYQASCTTGQDSTDSFSTQHSY